MLGHNIKDIGAKNYADLSKDWMARLSNLTRTPAKSERYPLASFNQRRKWMGVGSPDMAMNHNGSPDPLPSGHFIVDFLPVFII